MQSATCNFDRKSRYQWPFLFLYLKLRNLFLYFFMSFYLLNLKLSKLPTIWLIVYLLETSSKAPLLAS